MAIAMVYNEEQMIEKLGQYTKGAKRSALLCATLVERTEYEIEICYKDGILSDWHIKDTFGNEVGNPKITKDRTFLKFIIPHELKYGEGEVTIYGHGTKVAPDTCTFFMTDFQLAQYMVSHYTDRIQVLTAWGFLTPEVRSFPINSAIDEIRLIRATYHSAFGIFITKEIQEQNNIDPPFFYRFS